jgi:ATP-dependent DNA ligase
MCGGNDLWVIESRGAPRRLLGSLLHRRPAGSTLVGNEVVVLDSSGAPNFVALPAALSEKRSQDLVFFVFDLPFAAGEDLRTLPLSGRKERLKALLGAPRKQKDWNWVKPVLVRSNSPAGRAPA